MLLIILMEISHQSLKHEWKMMVVGGWVGERAGGRGILSIHAGRSGLFTRNFQRGDDGSGDRCLTYLCLQQPIGTNLGQSWQNVIAL